DIIIEQQVALDEAIVPHASQLRIGKSILVTSDVSEICMQELWATAKVHHHWIRFKMKNKKRIVNLEYFREMLQICPRIPHQQFDELPFEEEILAFLRELGHSKRLKTSAKVGKPAKEKQPAKSSKAIGLTVLSEVALTEAGQIKLAIKRSLIQTHISYASGSGADGGTDDDDDQDDDADQDDQNDDDDEQTDSDNDGDDFVHPKFSTHDEEDKDKESFDHIVQTPSQVKNTNDSSSVSSRFVSNMLKPSPDTGIDSIFESTPQVDVSVMNTIKLPLLSAKTLPPSSIPIISQVQQKPVPSPVNVPSSSMLQDEAQAENEDLFNKLDETIQKIIMEQIKVQVSKILPKIENTVNEQLEAEDKDEEPSAGSNWGAKRRREGKEPESTSALKEKTSKTSGKSTEGSKSHHKTASESAPAEEPIHTTQDLEELVPQEFETGATDDQPIKEASHHPHCNLTKKADSRTSFNELMSVFVTNRLKVHTLTPELLVDPTYELMKGSCKSLVELEFLLEEVYKATTDQLNWNKPEGQQYPHDLLKPLPLIPNFQGSRVIHFGHFINNDLEYLCGGASSQKYTTSVTKTKAADYGHIKWIEDLIPRTMWSQVPYLPQTIWRRSDKDRAAAMIQAIGKQLKTRSIMRSLEKFVGGRLYEGDFWLLQRTI
nr:hypothetical protein [Tanacetum cinerariifolium]